MESHDLTAALTRRRDKPRGALLEDETARARRVVFANLWLFFAIAAFTKHRLQSTVLVVDFFQLPPVPGPWISEQPR